MKQSSTPLPRSTNAIPNSIVPCSASANPTFREVRCNFGRSGRQARFANNAIASRSDKLRKSIFAYKALQSRISKPRKSSEAFKAIASRIDKDRKSSEAHKAKMELSRDGLHFSNELGLVGCSSTA